MEDTTASGQMDRGAEDVQSQSADFNETRRGFLKGALTVGGIAASWGAAGLSSVSNAQAQPAMVPGPKNHYYIPA
ncbi:MAG TPA: twin-arginine translocation signal domain-containing protein, partial [Methylomirabilota bacterium]